MRDRAVGSSLGSCPKGPGFESQSRFYYFKNKFMKKVAIVVGHTKLRPGACGIDIPCEFSFNQKVAEYLGDICDIYYYDSYNLGYKSMVKRNADKMNRKDYDLVIELHYNAASPQANGCEVFYYFTNKTGKMYAEYMSKMISKVFKVRDRGAKPMIGENQRGYWALFYPKATTLLLEPFFGSNRQNALKFKGKEKEYSEMIRDFLKRTKLV